MPWFVVDDSAHSHPKIIKAGNAAVGLWMRCGSYAAQHLTDGIVPGAIASMYGTSPQAAKLVKLGLWHPAGHDCPGCAQPAEGDYVMHDYNAYNPTRRQVLDRRARAADKKRRQRGESAPEPPDPTWNHLRNGRDSRTNRDRIEDETEPIHSPVFDKTAGDSDVSRGDSPETRARAFPSPPLPSKEKVAEERETPTGSRNRAAGKSLSQIPTDWKPSPSDLAAATADTKRLGPEATRTATAKFVRHHQAKGTTAANFGPLWVSWIARERPEPQQGAFLVGLPGGGQATPTPPTFSQRIAELDALAEADRQGDRQTGEAG
ncbi:hypothetical protein [Streptomyces qinglanensis]|uniref:hypothetical protein n=1 Tax=Streptomyces qinglanensis TaxID=943816 RepID=UPI003D74ADC7